MKRLRESAIVFTLVAAVLWAISQVAWRYGSGSSLGLAGQRSLVGALLMSPVIVASIRDGRARRLFKSHSALLCVVAAAATMPFTATLFRELTGPQAALVTGVTPAAILLFAGLAKSKTTARANVAVLLSVAFACVAAFSGGMGSFSSSGLWGGAVLLILNVVLLLSMERAREEFDAAFLVAAGMALATPACYTLAFIAEGSQSLGLSGVVAASIVGIAGTAARVLRGIALPDIGSAASASAAQLTALLTGAGGVILFRDAVDLWSVGLGLLAAAASIIAVVEASRIRR